MRDKNYDNLYTFGKDVCEKQFLTLHTINRLWNPQLNTSMKHLHFSTSLNHKHGLQEYRILQFLINYLVLLLIPVPNWVTLPLFAYLVSSNFYRQYEISWSFSFLPSRQIAVGADGSKERQRAVAG